MQVWHRSGPGGESVNSTGYPTFEKPIRACQINTIDCFSIYWLLLYYYYYYYFYQLLCYYCYYYLLLFILLLLLNDKVNPLLTLTPTIQTQSHCFNMDTSLLHTVLFSWQKKLMMPNFIYSLSLLHRHFHKTYAWVLH